MENRNEILQTGSGIDRLLGILAGTGKNYNLEKIQQAFDKLPRKWVLREHNKGHM